jgi:hypothetical protein
VLTLGATGPEPPNGPAAIKTAIAIFTGSSIVFGGITNHDDATPINFAGIYVTIPLFKDN